MLEVAICNNWNDTSYPGNIWSSIYNITNLVMPFLQSSDLHTEVGATENIQNCKQIGKGKFLGNHKFEST